MSTSEWIRRWVIADHGENSIEYILTRLKEIDFQIENEFMTDKDLEDLR